MTAVLQTTPAGDLARDAVVIDENVPLGQAWHRLYEDPQRSGIIVRGRLPLAVVTAGDLAERWPGGGPLRSWAPPVGSVLPRPFGVEILDAAEAVGHAARRVLASGLPALPVAPADPSGSWRLLGLRELLEAALDTGRPS